jgi:hypothetical protein
VIVCALIAAAGTSAHDARLKQTPRENRRNIMRKSVYRGAVVAAFLASVALATAAEINLTAQQKQTIMQSVQADRGQAPPVGFLPRVGAAVPQSMPMRQLPPNVTNQIPAAKGLEYSKLDNNDVLLIDPKDRRVAEIITPSSTTGAAPAPTSPPPRSPAPGAPR